jgi:hypothetical protein
VQAILDYYESVGQLGIDAVADRRSQDSNRVEVLLHIRAALRLRCDGRLRDIEETGFSRIARRG